MAEQYSEHEKLKALGGKNQAVGDFLEWLGEEGIFLCRYKTRREEYYPINESRDDLLATHFNIDRNKLEDEKRAMLDAIRKINNVT